VVLAGIEYPQVVKILGQMRREGVNVAVDSTPGRKIGQAMKMADKKGIRYAVIIGDAELAVGRYKLKNLSTGKEDELSLERLISTLKDTRKK
jgi:histidyl-tRNA synthetase